MKERLQKVVSLGLLTLIFASFPEWMRKEAGKARGWACEWCGKKFSDGFMCECHHAIPEHEGGEDEFENMVILCLWHHYQAHLELDDGAANAIKKRYELTKGGRTRQWLKQEK